MDGARLTVPLASINCLIHANVKLLFKSHCFTVKCKNYYFKTHFMTRMQTKG